MKINISKDTIVKIAKAVGGCFALGALVMYAPCVSTRPTVDYSCGAASYSDAVEAVMKSDMLSSYRVEMLSLIKRDETYEYYNAVISVIKSDMLTSNKILAIKAL